jgi:UPF0755 protein
MAALHPAKTEDLYFVADGSGGHAFSATLKDHNAAVQKWREIEKQKAKENAAGGQEKVIPIPQPKDDASNKVDTRKNKTARASKETKTVQKQASASGDDASTGNPAAAQASEAANTTDIPLPVRKPKRQ